MTAGKVTLLIVCSTHRLAQQWAQAQCMQQGTYKTVTQADSLRGLKADHPIVLLDTSIRFNDIRVIPLLSKRFTNVRHERL